MLIFSSNVFNCSPRQPVHDREKDQRDHKEYCDHVFDSFAHVGRGRPSLLGYADSIRVAQFPGGRPLFRAMVAFSPA